jgi:hypothetical protein
LQRIRETMNDVREDEDDDNSARMSISSQADDALTQMLSISLLIHRNYFCKYPDASWTQKKFRE